MGKIKEIKVRKIFDSRGNITCEVSVKTDKASAVASSPSGASIGKNEKPSFPKKGIDFAIKNFEKIKKKFIGFESSQQKDIDLELEKLTNNLEDIGANIANAFSFAIAKVSANEEGLELFEYIPKAFKLKNKPSIPKPLGNIFGGGMHSNNSTTIQEFLVASNAKTFFDACYENILVHKETGKQLQNILKNQSIGLEDEKAWTAAIDDFAALTTLRIAKEKVEKERKTNISLGLDVAATFFFDGKNYVYRNRSLDSNMQVDFLVALIEQNDIKIVEDPFHEDDHEGFKKFTKAVGKKVLVVGDDLYATNPRRIEKGAKEHLSNAVLIKPNQVGNLTRTVEAFKVCQKYKLQTIVSHRSGETTDNYIAHLAVAFASSYIKTGTIGGERVAKLNEVCRIEEILRKEQ
ncbi:MAG: phosphopyruvate hydratase [Candidatus Micrarchaeia archaeon]